jgi:flavin-dependent dehydrogenase
LRVGGVRAKTPDGEREFRANLVIGADGRHAITHTRGEFELRDFGAPIDVLWDVPSETRRRSGSIAWIFPAREAAGPD